MNTDNLKKELDAYLATQKPQATKVDAEKEVVITLKTGLVERIEKTLITPDGRTLLTERYY